MTSPLPAAPNSSEARRRRTVHVVATGAACIFGGEALCLLGPSAYEQQVHLLCHVILYSGVGLVIAGTALYWMSVRQRPSR